MPLSPNAFSTLLLAAHWALAAGLSLRVIARRLPVGVSLAWLAVVLAFPFAGAAAYLMFGGRRLGRDWLARLDAVLRAAEPAMVAERSDPRSTAPVVGAVGEALHRQTLGMLGIPAHGGNQLTLLGGSEAVFDALVRDIDGAAKSCHLAFYIWHEGGRADDVTSALLRARDRGVECRVLVDAVGSKPFLRSASARRLRAGGVAVATALRPSLKRRADLRYHRKNVVIDDRVAYMGSQNLVDPRYFKQDAGVGRWVDAVVRIEGPAARSLRRIFEVDWCVETGRAFEPMVQRGVPDGPADTRSDLVQVVPSGPAPDPDVIRRLLLTAIYSARTSLTLTTPYFVPDEAVVIALASASMRGVTVTLIVPAENDSILVRYASVSHFEDLLSAGVRIALFDGGLLHTKSVVVDGSLSIFGSVNLDMRSFWLDFEVSLFIQGVGFARDLSTLHERYLTESRYLALEAWRARSTRQRFLENAARLAGPLL